MQTLSRITRFLKLPNKHFGEKLSEGENSVRYDNIDDGDDNEGNSFPELGKTDLNILTFHAQCCKMLCEHRKMFKVSLAILQHSA